MSTTFTTNYDAPAATRITAASVFPTQQSSASAYLRGDQITPMTGNYRFTVLSGSHGTLSSLGTSTAGVAGKVWYSSIFVPVAGVTLTGAAVLNGATVGTDKGLVALFDPTGVLLANSATAGATTAGANAFQQYAFTSTYTITKPGRFFVAYSSNGTTDNFKTIAAATWIDVLTTSATGTFGTIAALTPPTTFTADNGPVMYLY